MLATVEKDEGFTRVRAYGGGKWVPNWIWFYRAKQHTKEVLEINIYTRESLLVDKEPIYRVFLHNDKYDTYDMETKKWRIAGIDHLEYKTHPDYFWYANNYIWMREKERKIIIAFTKNDTEEPRAAVQKWQSAMKHRPEINRIDTEMALVPELPKDFDTWVDKEATTQYIFYEAGPKVKEGHCTHCNQTVAVEKPKYNQKGDCSNCRHPITYKSNKKSGHIIDCEHVGLLQKTKAGFVYRYYNTYKRYINGRYKESHCNEMIRVVYDKDFKPRHEFEWYKFKSTQQYRWCFKYAKSYAEKVAEHPVALYPRNLKKILKGTCMQYSALELFAKQGKKYKKFYPEHYIDTFKSKPWIEQLVKCGFNNLVSGIIQRSQSGYLEMNERATKKILNLQAEYYKLLVGKDPTADEFAMAHRLQRVGIKATWQQLTYLAGLDRDFTAYLQHTTLHKLIRYIKETLKNKYIEDYQDYLRMANSLGYDLKNSFLMYPRDMMQAHDIADAEIKERDSRIRYMKAKERNKEMKKLYEEYKELYTYEDRKFIIRPAKSATEIKKEGNALHHCVGTYASRVLKRETIILFIREKGRLQDSLITVEIKNDKIAQARAKYNQEPDKEVKKFLKKFEIQILKRKERKAS